MWLKTKDCGDSQVFHDFHLINLDKYTDVYVVPYREENEGKYHESYEVKIYMEGSICPTTTIARVPSRNTANKLIEAIADAIASGERFFDVDEFLALSKLQEGAKK